MTPHLEKIAREVFKSTFHPDDAADDALVDQKRREWPQDWRRAEQAARAALSAALSLTPDDFAALGYRGLNRTRDTANAAHAAFTAGIHSILNEE